MHVLPSIISASRFLPGKNEATLLAELASAVRFPRSHSTERIIPVFQEENESQRQSGSFIAVVAQVVTNQGGLR
jgi:hypothetical protein